MSFVVSDSAFSVPRRNSVDAPTSSVEPPNITYGSGSHMSFVTRTKGQRMPPTRAKTELTPSPMLRTDVGNSSTLIRYDNAYAPLTKNFPETESSF